MSVMGTRFEIMQEVDGSWKYTFESQDHGSAKQSKFASPEAAFNSAMNFYRGGRNHHGHSSLGSQIAAVENGEIIPR